MGEIKELTAKTPEVYTGLDIVWDAENGSCEINQERYVADIKTQLTEKEKRRMFAQNDLRLTEPSEVNEAFRAEQQAWTGVLGWCSKTQPNLSVVFSEVSRNCTRPSAKSVCSAKRACEYAKEVHSSIILEGVSKPYIVWWVDASYSLRSCDGRMGYEVQV